MDKRHKEMQTLLANAGLEAGRIYDQKGRVHGEGTAPNGRTQVFSLSGGSRGDPRGDLNEHARMKRFAKANPKLTTAASQPTQLQAALQRASILAAPPIEKRRITIDLEQPESAPPASDPPPPSTMTMPAPKPTPTAAAKQIRKLTQIEFYQLCEWLKGAKLQDVATFAELERLAHKGTDIDVSASTIREAYAATKLELPEKLRAPAPPDHVVVAKILSDFMRKLGEAPPPELLAIAVKLERV